jgi:hypothetical protein
VTYRLSAEQAGAEIVALRWMLWRMDREEWLETPLDEGMEEPPCPVADADGQAVLEGLGALVMGAKQALAVQQLGITDPAEVTRFTRVTLKDELEAMERAGRRALFRVTSEADD